MDAATSTPQPPTKTTPAYKLKKGTIRRKFFECGFEAGLNCTIAAIRNSLKPDQIIRYTEMLKFLDELILPADAHLKEFDKIKHKHLSQDELRKRKSSPNSVVVSAKPILVEETTTTIFIDEDEPRLNLTPMTLDIAIDTPTSDIPTPDHSTICDDTSSVITDTSDLTSITDTSTPDTQSDKVYITFPAINTGESIDTANPIIKKRGRKRKTFIHRHFYNPNYIALWDEICNGDRVLVDCVGNVYTYDMENPKYLGKYQLDGKIDTTKPYISPISNFEHNYNHGRGISGGRGISDSIGTTTSDS